MSVPVPCVSWIWNYFTCLHCRLLASSCHDVSKAVVSTKIYRLVAGFSLGNVVALPVSGVLCSSGIGDGWDAIFYVFGKKHDRAQLQNNYCPFYSRENVWVLLLGTVTFVYYDVVCDV